MAGATSLHGVTIKASPWKVESLAQLKRDGKLHLPDLQRGFVWTSERVRALLDSLYRRYPVGALLLWKPTWEGSDAPFVTRAWDLCPPDPKTGEGAMERPGPVERGSYFVLDGQQRLTSLFRVIFRSRQRGSTVPDPDLLVSLSPEPAWADNPFHLRTRQLQAQLREGLLVPAEVLFEGAQAVQTALRSYIGVEHPAFFSALDRANAIRNAVLGAEIVSYEIDAEADDDNVIEIFARLNQQGVRLRPGDLAAARLTGIMKGFRERATAALGSPELKGFAAAEGEEDAPRRGAYVDTDLLVRTALFVSSGVLRYRDVEKRAKAEELYAKVEESWDKAVAGLTAAVKMFRKAGVTEGSWLPYRYLLMAPAVAEAHGQKVGATQWLGWAIAASLWGHYGSSAETKAQADCKLAAEGRVLDLYESVKASARRSESLVPDEEDLVRNVPLESGVLLTLLVYLTRTQARSFPSGRLLASAVEPVEVTPLFPRQALDKLPSRDSGTAPDRLGNLALLFRSDAERLRGRAPAEALKDCSEGDLQAHGVPTDAARWSVEHYEWFCAARERAMAKVAVDLLRSYGVP
ncbi:MAG TPA: DUF262 domain-containing protein [Myxococcaceae bacterium]|nr:DUF262 domain-containing protein [Myxococcaceae bacterium]